ncbi:hypothetical protein [Pleomorphomonas oryzae]|uniref:hypothetical protein n=1 Tax=Pleomorphomonas oryzae TaxID=261934 RepID=UPI00047A43EC|nr:hypothetical protein [Pleomorphomonas oryzae]
MENWKIRAIAAIYAAAVVVIIGYQLTGGYRLGLWWLLYAAVVTAIASGALVWHRAQGQSLYWRASVVVGVMLMGGLTLALRLPAA